MPFSLMYHYLLILWLIPIIIVHGQQLNPSLILHTEEITYEEFNNNSNYGKKIKLDKSHSISWQISLTNNLVYDSGTDVIIRFYDSQDQNKFIEIGMGGGPQQNKFWVGMLTSDNQYLVPYHKLDRGWIRDTNIIITYTERAGLTVNNGERIVLSNLDIGNFSVLYYNIDKTSNNNHDDYVSSGSLILEFMSGDPAQNPYHLFPFYLVGSIGCVVVLLLIFTKRS